jgi:ABC-type sulfate transport system permease component
VDTASQQELLAIYSDSYLTAFSAAMLFLALMAGIGYFVARRLPSTRLVEEEPVVAEQG